MNTPLLHAPLTFHGLTLKNRLVMPPMATSATLDGAVNDKILHYYNEKSAGGYLGLVITEHSYVSPQGSASPRQMSAARDSDIEGLRQLATTIHANGTKAIAQINHAGSAAHQADISCVPISASALAHPRAKADDVLPAEMTHAQIAAVTADFAAAARRVKAAGFDGVEIHAAHGYLLNQFYSPLTNHRTDEYTGKTLEGRLRFHKEVIAAVRAEVGGDFVVALRLGGCDYTAGGSTIEDCAEAAKLLMGCGIDLLDISGGMNIYNIAGVTTPGYFAPMAKAARQAVASNPVPVLVTGGITTAAEAEAVLADGAADLVGVGRAIFKDSGWAKRAME